MKFDKKSGMGILTNGSAELLLMNGEKLLRLTVVPHVVWYAVTEAGYEYAGDYKNRCFETTYQIAFNGADEDFVANFDGEGEFDDVPRT